MQQALIANQRARIVYSDRYADDDYEYRHVILPSELAKILPKSHLLTETEWRNIGVQQSPGWIHYMYHLPEPHILLFRRAKNHPIPSDFGRHPSNNNNNNHEQNFDIN